MRVRLRTILTVVIAACFVLPVQAKVYGDSVSAHNRAFILTGDSTTEGHRENIAELYSRIGQSFDEPGAPRFVFLDRKGEVALGIGGYVRGTGMYDFDGAIDQTGFDSYDIPVPLDPSQRQRFGADASQSTIFLKLVTRPTKYGRFTAYMQTGFTSAADGYRLKLKQAYISIGHVTAGLARSTFADGESQAPTIDSQGPSGQITAKNMLFRYTADFGHGFSGAVSIENPSASYTLSGSSTESIAQRVPDLPFYLQYAWNSESHVRLSFIYRALSYRDMVNAENRIASGWGMHLSSVGDICGPLGYFGHVAYGKGIARYINDLSDNGYDLVPSGTVGRLKAPGALAWTVGLSYNFTKCFFMTANCSHVRVYDCSTLGSDSFRADTYAAVNGFYNLTGDFRLGVECVLGRRQDYSRTTGHANRIEAMMQYNF